jgi:A/G-specific adenine glycosylase
LKKKQLAAKETEVLALTRQGHPPFGGLRKRQRAAGMEVWYPRMESKQDEANFREKLLAWFDAHARDLPWRQTHDPYAIWVSETMLQQTRVSVVVEYYTRFLARFPTLESLAAADDTEVLTQWSGLGYYRRARALHEAARAVMAEHKGEIPRSAAALTRLPGVGIYTAAAVASIAFGEAVPAVDGNVERVLTRYFGHEPVPGVARSGQLRRAAEDLVDRQRPGDFNQAMMELGATVCLPRSPLCLACPVRQGCATQGEHAAPRTKKMLSQKTALALVQRRQWPRAEVLLEQRPPDASQMPGMWELPLMKDGQESESMQLLTVRHSITNTNYYVTVYGLTVNEQKLLSRSTGDRAWVPVLDLNDQPLTGLTRKILKRLKVLPGYSGAGPRVTLDMPREAEPDLVGA